jgi:hypothetical protein
MYNSLTVIMSLKVIMSQLLLAFFMPEPKKRYYLCRFNRIDESKLDWSEYFPAQKGKKNSNTVNLFC